VHAYQAVSPWTVDPVLLRRGGPVVVPRERAPLARLLPYRRASGEPPTPTGKASTVARCGWRVNLGAGGLGDALLALALVQALVDGTAYDGELRYQGPHGSLMRRCRLPLRHRVGPGTHAVDTGRASAARRFTFDAVPECPHARLDLLGGDLVEIHAALPMRYYLDVEQFLGVRLPADRAPLPTFRSGEQARPFHVVFVSATSWPGRKDYGAARFARVAQVLAGALAAPWSFTLVTGATPESEPEALDGVEILAGPDAVDCLDVFSSAQVVIGNDTGLTHLAALTERADGSGPEVIGLYGRHAHTKWTTGNARHHAVATPFSQMLALADRCPVRDDLDDLVWSDSAGLAGIPAKLIAGFARELAGWG